MRIHKKIADVFGYSLYNKKKSHITLDLHLQKLFDDLNINCVIDVGANVGQFGSALRNSGYDGRIVSFEPVSRVFDELNMRALNDDDWHTYNFALGSENECKEINVASASVLSSFKSLSEYAKSDFLDNKDNIENTEDVQIRRLDDIFKDLTSDLSNPRIFLKLDTQGYDLEVLKGAFESIRIISGLQTEMSVTPIYEEMPGYIESLTMLRELGFEITGFYPVARDPKNLILIEFDCVMRNRAPVL